MGRRRTKTAAAPARRTQLAAAPASVVPAVLIALLTIVVFAPIFANSFTTWDDNETIWKNPSFNPPTVASVLEYWIRPHMDLYVPVTYQVWGLLSAIAQGEPDASGIALNVVPFHGANLVIHLASSLLAFGLFRQLLRSSGASSQWPAAIGALLFAVHPVQAETVAWISGTKDLLCGCFSILALYAYFRAQDTTRRVHWYSLATLALIIALLSKPTAVVVPLLAAATGLLPRAKPDRPRVMVLAGWFCLAAIAALVAKLVQPATAIPSPPMLCRPFIATDALSFYFRQLIFPLQLCVDYGRSPQSVLASGWVYFSWIVPAAVAAMLALLYRRQALLTVAGVLFIAPLLPILGLVPFDFQEHSTVADHYLYLPMLGVGLSAAVLASAFSRHRRTVVAISAAVVILLSVRTTLQLTTWRTTRTLFEHVLRVNPASWGAYNSLAEDALQNNEDDRAADLAAKGLQFAPDYAELHVTLGTVAARKGDLDRALSEYTKALESSPSHANAMASIAAIKAQRGDMAQALALVRKAIEAKPSCALAHSNYAVMLAQSGDLPEAARELELAVAYDAGDVGSRVNLAAILWELGRRDAARTHLSIALRMRPDDRRARQLAAELK